MDDFRLSLQERESCKKLYRSDLQESGERSIYNGSYYQLEAEHPELRDLDIPQKRYLERDINNIEKYKSAAKRSECIDTAQKTLRRLLHDISSLHGRVLREEYEDTFFRINTPYSGSFLPDPVKAIFSYSWLESGSWKHDSIEFIRKPSTPRPSGSSASAMTKIEEWHWENRRWLITHAYYQLRDYLGAIKNGNDLPATFDISEDQRLLPSEHHYDQFEYMLSKVSQGSGTHSEQVPADRDISDIYAPPIPTKSHGFHTGDLVSHNKFGLGVIAAIEGDKIEVDFGIDHGKKRVMASFLNRSS